MTRMERMVKQTPSLIEFWKQQCTLDEVYVTNNMLCSLVLQSRPVIGPSPAAFRSLSV